MDKKVKIIIASSITVVVLVIAIVTYMYFDGITAPSSKDEEVIVTISGGTDSVIDQLDEAGLLKSEMAASVYLKLNDYDFKANTYVLNKNMDLKTICKMIETADFKYILKDKFTVLEGTTIPEFATVVAQKLKISQNDVLNKWCDKEYLSSLVEEYWFLEQSVLDDGLMFPLEGYLAANTYFITEKTPTIESVTEMMLEQMDSNLTPYKQQIQDFKINGKAATMHQFLAFSSVVECESLLEEDRSKIAGVFIHRLETGMKLQSDVTVNYANQVTKVAVTYNELEVDSKYNTYKYAGLPAGPISAVSLDIIKACLNYEKTDALFFFAIKGGTVIYTNTYEEHMTKIQEAKASGQWLED